MQWIRRAMLNRLKCSETKKNPCVLYHPWNPFTKTQCIIMFTKLRTLGLVQFGNKQAFCTVAFVSLYLVGKIQSEQPQAEDSISWETWNVGASHGCHWDGTKARARRLGEGQAEGTAPCRDFHTSFSIPSSTSLRHGSSLCFR